MFYKKKYYTFGNTTAEDRYLVQTRSEAKSSGIKVPEAHGIGKKFSPVC